MTKSYNAENSQEAIDDLDLKNQKRFEDKGYNRDELEEALIAGARLPWKHHSQKSWSLAQIMSLFGMNRPQTHKVDHNVSFPQIPDDALEEWIVSKLRKADTKRDE